MTPDDRNVFLVAYDIADPKRLGKTSEILLGRGDRVQRSVFRCELSARDLVELRAALSEAIDFREDQVIFADLGPVDGRGAEAVTALGKAIEEVGRGATVV